RFPNGSPYWIPTMRSAAAPARIAARAVPGPPQRRGSDFGDGVADEAGDVSRSDDDSIDSGPLELVHLITTGYRHVRDRQLPDGEIGEELEPPLEGVRVRVVTDGEQEDLGVETVECLFELVRVSHLDHTVELVVVAAVLGVLE